MQKLFKDFFVVNRRKRKYKEKNHLSLFLNLKQQSMILQLAFVLTAIIIGARLGGIGLGVMRSEERRVGKECRSRWSPYH